MMQFEIPNPLKRKDYKIRSLHVLKTQEMNLKRPLNLVVFYTLTNNILNNLSMSQNIT